jgi:multimeric flavodoxin WrbA
MKVVAFNGSARKNGNTQVLIDAVFAELAQEGIETESVALAGAPVRGCRACYACFKAQNKRCAFQDNVINSCIEKMIAADGIILASPTYFANLTTEMKALIDRAGMVGRANGGLYRRKVGAAVVAVRRAGAIHTFNSLNHFFFISEMIVPGSCYWNIGTGREPGEASNDQEGMHTMAVLGKNLAWVLKKIK